MSSAALVETRSLGKSFGNFVALKDITLDIRPGEILTLLGPSGCGKSTLMRIIAGFEQPSSGQLLLNGSNMIPLPPERRPVNMVFQRYALFPHLDVFDNIAFGLRLKKLPEAEVHERVRRMIDLVQLGPTADRWISEISGGQAQRVALARALVNEPQVLLLDEPLAALDLKIRQLMLEELKRIQETTATTFVYVTHDQDEALMLSSRIALMDHGRIVQLGTPDEIYFHPNSMFAARFLGETNVLEGKVISVDKGRVLVGKGDGTIVSSQGPAYLKAGDLVSVVIRPEAVVAQTSAKKTADGPNTFMAQLKSVMPIGGKLLATAVLPDGTPVRFQQPRLDSLGGFESGAPVQVSWPEHVVSVLPKE